MSTSEQYLTHMYTDAHILTCTHTHVHTHTHTHTHLYAHTHSCAHTCTHVHTIIGLNNLDRHRGGGCHNSLGSVDNVSILVNDCK